MYKNWDIIFIFCIILLFYHAFPVYSLAVSIFPLDILLQNEDCAYLLRYKLQKVLLQDITSNKNYVSNHSSAFRLFV